MRGHRFPFRHPSLAVLFPPPKKNPNPTKCPQPRVDLDSSLLLSSSSSCVSVPSCSSLSSRTNFEGKEEHQSALGRGVRPIRRPHPMNRLHLTGQAVGLLNRRDARRPPFSVLPRPRVVLAPS